MEVCIPTPCCHHTLADSCDCNPVATFAFVGQMVLVGKDLGVVGGGAEEVVDVGCKQTLGSLKQNVGGA